MTERSNGLLKWTWLLLGSVVLVAPTSMLGSMRVVEFEAYLSASQESEIEGILSRQAACWNDKDIVGFMQTYWKSDALTFSAGGQTTRGWQATLDRYQRKYPPEKMGHLSFDHLEITMLSAESALVLGQWHLEIGDRKSEGNFTLVLRKMSQQWKIIHDHSSALENERTRNAKQ